MHMRVCPVIYLVLVVVVVAGMRRRRSNLVSRFVVVAALSLLPPGTLCVSFLSLSLIHISRLQQLLESVKHTRCYCCLSIDIAILTRSHAHTQLHSLEVIILARILLLATRRRRNAAAAQPHGNVSKQQLTGQRHKQSTVGGTLWEWNSNEQRNERSKDFA